MDPDIIKVRDQQWAALIQDRIQSGLTVEEWCRQQNIGMVLCQVFGQIKYDFSHHYPAVLSAHNANLRHGRQC